MGRVFRRGSATRLGILGLLTFLAAPPLERAEAFPVAVSDSPASALQTTLAAIQKARKVIHVNIYEFTSEPIAEALVDRIEDGVTVKIIQEGQPVGGFSEAAQDIQDRLLNAMSRRAGGHRYYVMTKGEEDRRFRFDHAKYIVVDDDFLYLGSENFTKRGTPLPGDKGARGWQVFLHDERLASRFKSLFREDSDTQYGDIEELETARFADWLPPIIDEKNWTDRLSLVPSRRVALPSAPLVFLDARSAEAITSPDTSKSGLIKLIDGADKTLDIQQMTFSPEWGATKKPSPLLHAVFRAARRGVAVRVLLNDERAFIQHSDGQGDVDEDEWLGDVFDGTAKKNKNQLTVDQINEVAEDEGLELEARIADVKEMGVHHIHNKGLLVDGKRTLISSINWNQNSVENNREAGISVESAEVYRHFAALFQKDWEASE